MTTETDEVAGAMTPLPTGYTYDDALRQTRVELRGESETVISMVAWIRYRTALTAARLRGAP